MTTSKNPETAAPWKELAGIVHAGNVEELDQYLESLPPGEPARALSRLFLPIISDMSGCSGNQAVAVSMRELVLGMIKPYEHLRVLWKEAGIGLINGAVLGIVLGGVAFLWKGNPVLGLVVGVALALNTVLAVCLGGTIPLLLRRMNQDPAIASGPILTTLTDTCGFFLVLSLARLALPWLTAS